MISDKLFCIISIERNILPLQGLFRVFPGPSVDPTWYLGRWLHSQVDLCEMGRVKKVSDLQPW